jgi:seryl-tRNA synthetase
MLDPKLLRTDLDAIAEKLRVKNYDLDKQLFNQLENQRKSLQVSTQQLQSERNSKSKAIGKAKARGDDVQVLLDQVADLGDRLKQAETELGELQTRLEGLLLVMPNIPDESVPAGGS